MARMRFDFDAAIIGGGLAGLALALSLDPKMQIAVFAKRGGGGSNRAQGGIAAALAKGDSFAAHLQDTVAAGAGLCDEETARFVVSQGPEAVRWLADLGVPFSRDEKGGFNLAREGGHRAARIAHVADATGRAIQQTLAARLGIAPNVSFFAGYQAIDLFMDGDVCRGFYALDIKRGEVAAIGARAVALATGGAGRVYLYTTNPFDSTGDGMAMAARAGRRIVNMEFVQFHPTCLYHPRGNSFLISEAVRGEGGILIDGDGRRFMADYHPDAELAPRDIVARAIDSEMKKQGANCVYLDLRALSESFIQKRFPTICKRCLELGIDICARPIPVVPAAHYCCGGVAADGKGRAGLANLYALGEVAHSGLHGANRLASNSLLECVVFAREAASAINQGGLANAANPPPPWDASRITRAAEAVTISHNWDALRRLMWNYVGIVRSDERLARARKRIGIVSEEVEDYYRRFAVTADFLELRNLALCAQMIVESACRRRESRGLHYNADCPQTTAAAENTALRLAADGSWIAENAAAASGA